MNIVDFINARLDDDERIARSAIDHKRPGTHWQWVYIANDVVVTPGWLEDPHQEQAVSLRTVEQFPTTSGVGDLPAFAIKYAEEVHPGAGEHVARHDPARVLREVQAKRAILAEHEENEGQCARCLDDDGVWVEGGRTIAYAQPWPCRTIRALANVHVDHPDFVAEWKL